MQKFFLVEEEKVREGQGLVARTSEGDEVALFRLDGKIYALDNTCPHLGGPLGEGEVSGELVECPWHCWEFDIKTGVCQNCPGEDATPLHIEVSEGAVFLLKPD